MKNRSNQVSWIQAIPRDTSKVRVGLGPHPATRVVELSLEECSIYVVEGVPYWRDSRQGSLGLGLVSG